MVYLEHKPAPPLSSFIQALWYAKGYRVPHQRERVFPNGSIQVVMNLAHDYLLDCGREAGNDEVTRMPASLIAGVHSEYMVIDTSDLEEIIGMQFWPGGFVPFFAIPADEFSNAQISLEAVWGREACDLRNRVREATSPPEKFRVLESTMLARAQGRLVRHCAVTFALQQFQSFPHTSRIADVTEHVGLSSRRFAQVFREQVGVTPKFYCRIRRFQQAIRQISLGHDVNWTEIALSCGYFDQSHFVNDFRAFSGINPTTYVASRLQWLNHVPLG
jgi:AraC-like DNA-binding protein